MKADLTTLVGISASVFIAVALLPQLTKLIKEKKPHGVSFLTLGSLFIGAALWIVYGAFKNDWIIISSNAISLLLNSTIGLLSMIYKKRNTDR